MKKLEVITRPEKLEDLKDVLDKIGIKGMTVYNVLGYGNQRGFKEFYRGTELSVNLLPKIKLELVVNDNMLEEVISAIQNTASTGNVGDGKMFVSPVDETIRIRTGERSSEI